MPSFRSRWLDWTPETSKESPDKPDRRAFGGNVGSIPTVSPPETPDLSGVVPVRDGTPLQQAAYRARDERLIAERKSKAIELQAWLTDHLDEHMSAEPSGLPEWMSAWAEFDVVERGHLRNVFHFTGCIHAGGRCPTNAPVCCTHCAETGTWRDG